MRYCLLILIALTSASCAASELKDDGDKGDLFVSKVNFLEFPFYKEIDELEKIPIDGKCITSECNEMRLSGKTYYRAILLNKKNYSRYLLGVWSGGDCVNDRWSMDIDGNFNSHYPLDEGVYRWGGKYLFKGDVYIEDGKNSEGGKEWNEANLYYLPINGLLIYKGIRSFDGVNKDGSMKYTYYDGPDFYYFQNCGNP